MSGYITGDNRSQSTLFPESLDDYIHEENPVRVIDVFIDGLDLNTLGFERSKPSDTGRPGYAPATLLKLYLYGYLNRIQSSRRLEREAQRNVELMWLIQRLAPDFKTIADFRKDNGRGIKNACRAFIDMCRKLNMFTDAVIAVDGSKFKAVNSSDRNFTQSNIQNRIERVEKNIEAYLTRLDEADKAERPDIKDSLSKKLVEIKQHLTKLKEIDHVISNNIEKQVSLTDPDCRAMKTQSIGRTIGYNVQTAVDAKHHLIVANYVTNHVSDRAELHTIAKEAQAATGQKDITVVADKGYYSGNIIKDCQDDGMTPLVAKTNTSGFKEKGLFPREDFTYDADKDVYICPANRKLPYSYKTVESGKLLYGYTSVITCKSCTARDQCTRGTAARRIRRWEHEDRLENMEEKLKSMPEIMKIRKSTVEHPFGTIKSWMGATHFLTKRLENVSTEMNLHVLAYNIKRMINIVGQQSLINAIRTI
jgi:transposase